MPTQSGGGLGGLFGGSGGPDWGGMLGSYLEYQGQNDMADKLEQYMNMSANSADPFAPNRPESAKMLMDLYRDPMSNVSMNALATNAKRAMEAKDAAAGRNSQYGERETQLAGLLAGQLGQIANPLLTMSGATANPNAKAQAYQAFGMPLAATELGKSGALGYGASALINGKQPSILEQLMGGQGGGAPGTASGGGIGGWMNQAMSGLGGLFGGGGGAVPSPYQGLPGVGNTGGGDIWGDVADNTFPEFDYSMWG
jgi:hypothetical protein